MKSSIRINDVIIEKENVKTETLETMITTLDNRKEEKKEQYDILQSEYIKQKDEPNRLGKQNENLKIQVNHQQRELDGFMEKKNKYTGKLA